MRRHALLVKQPLLCYQLTSPARRRHLFDAFNSLQVEETKKAKEVVKRGDDEPDWASELSSWKDRRRKQSEEALQRVAEVKALDDGGEDFNQRQKM